MKDLYLLLIEDNEGDILLTTETILEHQPGCTIEVARNGQDAVELIEHMALNTSARKPDLVLLDINLPRKNGHEILQFIKAQPRLIDVPVIILTTSSSPLDITKAYEERANSYLTKPTEAESFSKMIEAIVLFWSRNVQA